MRKTRILAASVALATAACSAAPAAATVTIDVSGDFSRADTPGVSYHVDVEMEFVSASADIEHPLDIAYHGTTTQFSVDGVSLAPPSSTALLFAGLGRFMGMIGQVSEPVEALGYLYLNFPGIEALDAASFDVASQAMWDGLLPTMTGDFARNMTQYNQISNFSLTVSGTAPIVHVSAIPEISSWVLMLGGFGLVGCAMRRRTVNVSFA